VLQAARWKYRTLKNRHFGTIAQLCRTISLELRHVSPIGKKLLNSNTSSTCPDNMVNFGLLTAEICRRVWGTPANFNGRPLCFISSFFRLSIGALLAKIWCQDGDFWRLFCVLYFQRAACSTFQTCILNSH